MSKLGWSVIVVLLLGLVALGSQSFTQQGVATRESHSDQSSQLGPGANQYGANPDGTNDYGTRHNAPDQFGPGVNSYYGTNPYYGNNFGDQSRMSGPNTGNRFSSEMEIPTGVAAGGF